MRNQHRTICQTVLSTIITAMIILSQTGCSNSGGGSIAPPVNFKEQFEPLAVGMEVCRAKQTVTKLTDGTLLIVGGYETDPVSRSHSSAEVFNPFTREFTATGSLQDRRQCHTATLLPDGRVLVAGGNNETDEAYTSAELYDPATGEFSATGSMAEERTCAMATLLPNGTVLLAGGYDTLGAYSSTAEIYDPATGTFGAPIAMNYEHSCHAQVLMGNGLVLLTTGCISGVDRVELFDWTDSSFRYVGDLSSQRKYPFFELLPDGRVLIAGGLASGDDVPTAEIYTPSYTGGPGELEVLEAKMSTGRWRGAHGLLPDGRVLLMGGATGLPGGGSAFLLTAEIFDPLTETFTGGHELSNARGNWPRFAVTDGGYGIVFGGIDGYGDGTDTCDIWPTTNSSQKGFVGLGSTMSVPRAKQTATLLADGEILVAGGYKTEPANQSHSSAELFDPVARKFGTTGSMTVRRQCHTATLLPDGKVLITGGNNETDEAYRSAEIYDPVTGEFAATGSMAEERTCAMATLLPNGTVLVAGGYDTVGDFSITAELYDPATGTFSAPIAMNYQHSCHAQVLMGNGLVLLTTGCLPGIDRVELFDYTDNSFRDVGDLSSQRKYPFFELLPDGRVLIAGGLAEGDDVATAEVYTPSYSGGPGEIELLENSLVTGRWRGAHGVLPDGRVLLMGGATGLPGGGSAFLLTAELFDPVTETFSGKYEMSSGRGNWPRFVLTRAGYGIVFGGIDGYGKATDTCDVWAVK